MEEIQKTLLFDNGGQPGHREAWLDNEVNRRSLKDANLFLHFSYCKQGEPAHSPQHLTLRTAQGGKSFAAE